jgi:hypothetical protein
LDKSGKELYSRPHGAVHDMEKLSLRLAEIANDVE